MSQPLPGVDIGNGHSLEEFNHEHDGNPKAFGGFIEWHTKPDGVELCGGAVSVCPTHPNRNGARWSMTGTLAAGDLTLTPSLQCTGCSSHGFVQNGRWVSA